MNMNWLSTLLPLGCLILGCVEAFSLDYSPGFFPDDTENDIGGSYSTISADKRYGISSACRRCMFRRDDWTSCTICYSRPGPVPFYGGYAKRSSSESVMPGTGQYSGEGTHVFTDEKRAAMDSCRCCLSSRSDKNGCCSRCNLTPYFGSYTKRGYHTSFAPISYSGAGLCNSCCSPETFDYYCCVFSCADKKRK